MVVKNLSLQGFRNHHKRTFDFGKTTIIIGHNTAGKTNILEALYILSHGTSFRASHDADVIEEKRDFTKLIGRIESVDDTTELTVSFARTATTFLSKKYQVNGVARTLKTFSDYFYTVLFTPQDIEIITASPSVRRRYIDSILTKAHKEYRAASNKYEKALRQRNRMLHDMKTGKKEYKSTDFEFWENLLIENGGIIHNFRNAFVEYVNAYVKEVFKFALFYDHSAITTERLFKYHFEERASGVTLIGPQRDDFQFLFEEGKKGLPAGKKEIREFGSRGEQRLTILQMKLIEISYLKQATSELPVLLLDDIFSELDEENIDKIYHFLEAQQTIITTTHQEFVPHEIMSQEDLKIIQL